MGALRRLRIAKAMPPRHELSLTPFLQPTACIPEVSSVAGLLVSLSTIEGSEIFLPSLLLFAVLRSLCHDFSS
jgi:hypothetical protein